jgi:hypothetical protein
VQCDEKTKEMLLDFFFFIVPFFSKASTKSNLGPV